MSANGAEPIFSARNEAIGWEEAYDILQSQHQYTCCNFPPVKPRAGEVFLFSASEASKRSKFVKLCTAYVLASYTGMNLSAATNLSSVHAPCIKYNSFQCYKVVPIKG